MRKPGQLPDAAKGVGGGTDLLIVGGGIMGLWAAWFAARAGLRTVLVEKERLGAGASGGLLGALMPHMPDKWSEKKQFQFDALVSLEEEIAALEAQTGLSTGYRRSGRLIALPKDHLRAIAERHSRDAETVWQSESRSFHWQVMDHSPYGSDWPDPSFTAGGLVHDTLAARLFPRHLLTALRRALEDHPAVTLLEGVFLTRLDPHTGSAQLSDGRELAFAHVVLAAGVESFALLSQWAAPGSDSPRLGTGVKGQAALLKADIDPSWPLLYLDGLYVVPQEGGVVAIGSTSENRYDDPVSTDAQLDDLLQRAVALVPSFRNAPVLERWAGVRPKAVERDPMVGPHPDLPRLIALTGGFKVSFGLAHRLAQAALLPLLGSGPVLPASFTLAHHLQCAGHRHTSDKKNSRNS
ncbi:FAD-binding oxidoreductase [Allorhizobium sp. BGMRC 0089]|nr:FAD-dependent oxidoreductase [Allorhizobium sonneratiae]MCM2291116.1 FAD-binding oxidoreductase [Allorhizobium sonneratiae]